MCQSCRAQLWLAPSPTQDLTQECESRLIIDATLWSLSRRIGGMVNVEVILKTELMTSYSLRMPASLCVNPHMEEKSWLSEQPLKFIFDHAVTFADRLFKFLAVENLNAAAHIADGSVILQTTGRYRHTFAAHT